MKKALIITNIVWSIGFMVVVIKLNEEQWRQVDTKSELKEIKAKFIECNSERMKVKEILKGDSLKTLMYW